MTLYMMAFMTTSVVEMEFFVQKACRVDHGFPDDMCLNIRNETYKEQNKLVQATVSEFHQWNDIAGHVVPIILALFMGSWSDRRGRKWPLILGLSGKLYYSTMIVVNSLQTTWTVNHIVYTATLPMAFTGADVAIFAAAFAYISDVSAPSSRTLRVTILEVFYLATMPTGIALGRYLFSNVTNQSYTIMFTINACLLLAALIYTCLRLEWRTSATQQPFPPLRHLFTDFFQPGHVTATLATMYKPRPSHRRLYLLLLVLAMACYTFQRDEKQMSYLYLQLVFEWSFDKISEFRTAQSAVQVIVLLLAVPILSRFLGWRDTAIMMVGATAHAVARIFYAAAEVGWLIYIGGIFASFGPIVAPVIRSMISKLVAPEERGKAFSVLSCADNAIPVVSGIVYNQVYKASIHTIPQAIFYVTIGTQCIVFLIGLFIQFKVENVNDLVHVIEEANEKCIQKADVDKDENIE